MEYKFLKKNKILIVATGTTYGLRFWASGGAYRVQFVINTPQQYVTDGAVEGLDAIYAWQQFVGEDNEFGKFVHDLLTDHRTGKDCTLTCEKCDYRFLSRPLKPGGYCPECNTWIRGPYVEDWMIHDSVECYA